MGKKKFTDKKSPSTGNAATNGAENAGDAVHRRAGHSCHAPDARLGDADGAADAGADDAHGGAEDGAGDGAHAVADARPSSVARIIAHVNGGIIGGGRRGWVFITTNIVMVVDTGLGVRRW